MERVVFITIIQQRTFQLRQLALIPRVPRRINLLLHSLLRRRIVPEQEVAATLSHYFLLNNSDPSLLLLQFLLSLYLLLIELLKLLLDILNDDFLFNEPQRIVALYAPIQLRYLVVLLAVFAEFEILLGAEVEPDVVGVNYPANLHYQLLAIGHPLLHNGINNPGPKNRNNVLSAVCNFDGLFKEDVEFVVDFVYQPYYLLLLNYHLRVLLQVHLHILVHLMHTRLRLLNGLARRRHHLAVVLALLVPLDVARLELEQRAVHVANVE